MNAENSLILEKNSSFAKDLGLIFLASILIAAIGSITIPLPFSPVPISLRLQTILLLSYLLGSRRAVLSIATFLVMGALGVPVFAGATFGLAAILGPCGGYIVGYLFAGLFAGYMREISIRPLAAFVVGTMIVYTFGAFHLAQYIGSWNAIKLGIFPFILIDALKTLIAIKISSWICQCKN